MCEFWPPEVKLWKTFFHILGTTKSPSSPAMLYRVMGHTPNQSNNPARHPNISRQSKTAPCTKTHTKHHDYGHLRWNFGRISTENPCTGFGHLRWNFGKRFFIFWKQQKAPPLQRWSIASWDTLLTNQTTPTDTRTSRDKAKRGVPKLTQGFLSKFGQMTNFCLRCP